MISSLLGFFKCKTEEKRIEVFLGAGTYTIEVPKSYISEKDEKEGIVMVYPKGSECITLRFDILTFEPKDESVETTTGYDWVKKYSVEKSEKLEIIDDKAISFHEEKSVEGGENLLMKYWQIGPKDNRVILMSATILEKKQNDKRVIELLNSIPLLLASIKATKENGAIETLNGQVEYTHTKVESLSHKVAEISEDERNTIFNWEKNGYKIVSKYYKVYNNTEITTEILDSSFSKWLENSEDINLTDEEVAQGLGVLFGNILLKEFQMVWVKVTDEYGEEFAVRHQKKKVQSFPISSVQKRIIDKGTGFFGNLYQMIKHTIENSDEL